MCAMTHVWRSEKTFGDQFFPSGAGLLELNSGHWHGNRLGRITSPPCLHFTSVFNTIKLYVFLHNK